MLAGERSIPTFLESVRDPTGSPVATNSVTAAYRICRARELSSDIEVLILATPCVFRKASYFWLHRARPRLAPLGGARYGRADAATRPLRVHGLGARSHRLRAPGPQAPERGLRVRGTGGDLRRSDADTGVPVREPRARGVREGARCAGGAVCARRRGARG